MKNGSFKAIRAAEAMALILSALLILAACAVPYEIVGRLCSDLFPRIESAREHVLNEEPEKALSELEHALSSIGALDDMLMIFYGHDDVTRLLSAAKAAVDLAKAQDRQQLLEEIAELEYGLRYIDEINRARVRDVF